MKSFHQTIHKFLYKPVLELYLKTDSNIVFDGFKLKVLKGVFHPKLFFSTKYFYDFIKTLELNNLNFLEIGCGSGILSLLAFKKGAIVTTVDIDKKAIENTKINFEKNFKNIKQVRIIQSNLFSNLPKQLFDVIIINPPYYFKKIEAESQYAWYCGQNGEYFENLFLGLSNYTNAKTLVFIILEENCEIERIKSIALKNKIHFDLVNERQIKWEKSFIFRLIKTI